MKPVIVVFSSLALAVVISLFASYFVALSIVPLFCARFIKSPHGDLPHESAETEHIIEAAPNHKAGIAARFNLAFNRLFERILNRYDKLVVHVLAWPKLVLLGAASMFLLSLTLFPLLGLSFFRAPMQASSSSTSRLPRERSWRRRKRKRLSWRQSFGASYLRMTWA